MKILLVSPLPPPVGGIATWTKEYIKFFKNKVEYKVDIINTAIQGKRIENNKKNIIEETKRFLHLYFEIKDALNLKEYDIIHYNSSCTLLGLIKDYLLVHKMRKSLIVLHCHCDLVNYVTNPVGILLFKKISGRCKKIFVLNLQSQAFVSKICNIQAKIVPNFINLSDFPENEEEKYQKTFVYTGRISREKGCNRIFNLAELLPEWKFILIGDTHCDLDITVITRNVEFLGILQHEDVIRQLKKANVFLFLSTTEGFSCSLLEAMASGLPVIATNVGSNAEMIEDKGGIIIDVNKQINFVDEIRKFIASEGHLDSCGDFNRKKAHSTYDINVVMKNIIEEYTSLIGI